MGSSSTATPCLGKFPGDFNPALGQLAKLLEDGGGDVNGSAAAGWALVDDSGFGRLAVPVDSDLLPTHVGCVWVGAAAILRGRNRDYSVTLATHSSTRPRPGSIVSELSRIFTLLHDRGTRWPGEAWPNDATKRE